MATLTVNTTADIVNVGDSVLSLREAIAQANATVAADAGGELQIQLNGSQALTANDFFL